MLPYFATVSTGKWRWCEPQYYGKGNTVVKTKQHNIYRSSLFRDGWQRYSNFLRPTAAFLRVITALSMCSILPHFVSRSSSKQHFCSCVTHNSEGPGIESWWGRHFPQPSTPDLGPYQPQVQLVPGVPFSGGKAAGVWRWQPLHLAPRLKKEYSYVSIRPLDLYGLLEGETYLNRYLFT